MVHGPQGSIPVKIGSELSKGIRDRPILLADIDHFRCNKKNDALPRLIDRTHQTIIRAQRDKASIINILTKLVSGSMEGYYTIKFTIARNVV